MSCAAATAAATAAPMSLAASTRFMATASTIQTRACLLLGNSDSQRVMHGQVRCRAARRPTGRQEALDRPAGVEAQLRSAWVGGEVATRSSSRGLLQQRRPLHRSSIIAQQQQLSPEPTTRPGDGEGSGQGKATQSSKRRPQPLTGGSIDEAVPGLKHTVWDQQDVRPVYPKLRENLTTDVVVVGAGIAGLSVAYNLAKAGKSVVVLEGKAIGSGQTGKTTAHLMPWNDDYYSVLEAEVGRHQAALVGDSHRKAIDWVERIVKEEGIDCNFSRVEGYLMPHDDNKETMQRLMGELAAAKRCGFKDIALVDLEGEPSMGSNRSVVKFPGTADFHPLKYVEGLAQAVERLGGRICEQSKVMHQNQTNRVTTGDEYSVSAGAVVLATNTPIHHNLAIHTRQPSYRTYIIGLKLPKGSVPRACWWDTAEPYHNVRIEEKEDHDVLVVGGENHPTGILSPNEYPYAYEALERWSRKRWPMAGERLYSWSAQHYKPIDYLHLLSRDPLNFVSDTYVATGDSGQNMTGGTIAGIVISDIILNRRNPWLEVYNASRLPPATKNVGGALLSSIIRTSKGFLENIPPIGSDPISVTDMSRDSGAVIGEDLKKVAVYKDKNGVVHRFSAVCPHLRCAVKWNPKDSSFDCPCHGSQFDTMGRCVQGPGKANLARIQ